MKLFAVPLLVFALTANAARLVEERECTKDREVVGVWTEGECVKGRMLSVQGNTSVTISTYPSADCSGSPSSKATVALGKCDGKMFVLKPETTYTCTVCGHVYDPAADGGGKAFEDLPDSWVCPICGSPKSAYTPSMVDGKKVWVHHHKDEKESVKVTAPETTYTCTVCGHVYDPAADGGGKAFEDLPDSWVCPICGSPKSAYTPSMVDGKKVWMHHHKDEKESVKKVSAPETTYTCTVCGHVYDPAADGGGKAFEDLPDSWVCPICGSPKSAYTPSMVDGKKVWVHHHKDEKDA